MRFLLSDDVLRQSGYSPYNGFLCARVCVCVCVCVRARVCVRACVCVRV